MLNEIIDKKYNENDFIGYLQAETCTEIILDDSQKDLLMKISSNEHCTSLNSILA